jgi:hypothetical protein
LTHVKEKKSAQISFHLIGMNSFNPENGIRNFFPKNILVTRFTGEEYRTQYEELISILNCFFVFLLNCGTQTRGRKKKEFRLRVLCVELLSSCAVTGQP